MGNLITANYRRDYTGETITYVENEEVKSINVQPRDLPYDVGSQTAIVLGNGTSRMIPEIQLLLNQNNNRPAEGYKMTYACNAAYRDTPADYYVLKTNVFFSSMDTALYNKLYLPNNLWLSYKDTNLIPYVYHMDAGSTAAYLAAFDGAKKVFLFGFDGNDGTNSNNLYQNTLGYSDGSQVENFYKSNVFLYDVIRIYNSTKFYRVRTPYSNDFWGELFQLPNYYEVNVRDAILAGDF